MSDNNKRLKLDNSTKVDVILGGAFGDEGKGKLVDDFSTRYDIVARAQGGQNAGHTVVDEAGTIYKLHGLPSGIINDKTICVIGNGVVIDIIGLFEEIDGLIAQGVKNVESRILISDRANVVFQLHKEIDGILEQDREDSGQKKIGTTMKGIGPAYSSKVKRSGVRVSNIVGDFDKFEKVYKALYAIENKHYQYRGGLKTNQEEELAAYKKLIPRLKPLVTDTVTYLNESIAQGKKILAEGANAALIDNDFGNYPFVTSSSCTIGGILSGLGIPASAIGEVVCIMKAYATKVGNGNMVTELLYDSDPIGKHLCDVGHEYGSTTNRRRRCGYFDCNVYRYSNMINGYTCYNITKLDVLTGIKTIKICTHYLCDGKIIKTMPADLDVLDRCKPVYEEVNGWTEDISNIKNYKDLPLNARLYVERIETLLGIKIKYIGVGAKRSGTLIKDE